MKENNRQLDLDFFEVVLVSPFGAMLGLFDGLVIAIPLLICFLLRFRLDILKSFLITICLCYSSISIYLYFIAKPFAKTENFIIIMPCFLLSMIVNWFAFRKEYQKLNIATAGNSAQA